MCNWNHDADKPHQMSFEEFRRITHELLPRVNVLFLSWATEPLLNLELAEILNYTFEAKVPCVAITSNFTMVSDSMIEILTNGALHRLNISLDAVNSATYAKIRQQDRFEQVINSIKEIVSAKTDKKSKYPVLAINMVLMKMNIDQLMPMIDLACTLGIREINCAPCTLPVRYQSKHTVHYKGLPEDFDLKDELLDYSDNTTINVLKKAIRYADDKNILLNIPLRLSTYGSGKINKVIGATHFLYRKSRQFPPKSMIHMGTSYVKNIMIKRRAYCSYPWRQMIVWQNGEVSPCCLWKENGVLGNIHSKSLLKIWESPETDRFRQRFLSTEIPVKCKECTLANPKYRHGI